MSASQQRAKAVVETTMHGNNILWVVESLSKAATRKQNSKVSRISNEVNTSGRFTPPRSTPPRSMPPGSTPLNKESNTKALNQTHDLGEREEAQEKILVRLEINGLSITSGHEL
jgi:hypothetical protein